MQVGDSICDNSHKFAPHEFFKLINAKKHLSNEDYAKWKSGTGGWSYEFINGKTSDSQLLQVLSSECLDDVMHNVNYKKLSPSICLAVLKEHRDAQLHEDEEERDHSPERS